LEAIWAPANSEIPLRTLILKTFVYWKLKKIYEVGGSSYLYNRDKEKLSFLNWCMKYKRFFLNNHIKYILWNEIHAQLGYNERHMLMRNSLGCKMLP